MKLEEIQELARVELAIDRSNLLHDCTQVPALLAKWLKVRAAERFALFRLQQEEKRLLMDKRDWLLTGDTKESMELQWQMPPRGRPMREDMKFYLDADKQMQEHQMKITLQKEKCDELDEILGHIRYRGNLLKSAIEMVKLESGA